MTALACAHGDPFCPCRDGEPCHYEAHDGTSPLGCAHCGTLTVDLLKHRKMYASQSVYNGLLFERSGMEIVVRGDLIKMLTSTIQRRLLINPDISYYRFGVDTAAEFMRDCTIFNVTWRENWPEPSERLTR